MCGATVDSRATKCPACGEDQQPTAEALAVPLFSPTAIGVCTFFWSHITGLFLVWLNCRRLGLYDAAFKTLLLGVLMTVVVVGLALVLPEGVPGTLLGILSVVAVLKYANSVLKVPFEQQKRQNGPYRSIWVGHGIGLVVILCLVSVVIGSLVLLGIAGFEVI